MVLHDGADASLGHSLELHEDWAMYPDGQELLAESEVYEEALLSFAADDDNTDQFVHYEAAGTDDDEVDAPQSH